LGLGAAIEQRGVLTGKGGLYGNVIRTGMMLNSTKDHVDELIEALNFGLLSAEH
jgi:4-aminobutyrate aminotransferase-like enzyme